jgi:large-conductance mechanosensitive channel
VVNLVYDYLFAYIGYSVVKFEQGQNHFWFDWDNLESGHNLQVLITWIVFLMSACVVAWVVFKYVKVYKVVKREEEEAEEDGSGEAGNEVDVISDEEAMVKGEDCGNDELNVTNENLVGGK